MKLERIELVKPITLHSRIKGRGWVFNSFSVGEGFEIDFDGKTQLVVSENGAPLAMFHILQTTGVPLPRREKGESEPTK